MPSHAKNKKEKTYDINILTAHAATDRLSDRAGLPSAAAKARGQWRLGLSRLSPPVSPSLAMDAAQSHLSAWRPRMGWGWGVSSRAGLSGRGGAKPDLHPLSRSRLGVSDWCQVNECSAPAKRQGLRLIVQAHPEGCLQWSEGGARPPLTVDPHL
eukprot:scaffold55679_cov38-Tisochrysis_lutea.AAC.1